MILSQSFYELRIDLEDWEGNTTFVKYQFFNIGKRRDNYLLEIGGHYGDSSKFKAIRASEMKTNLCMGMQLSSKQLLFTMCYSPWTVP